MTYMLVSERKAREPVQVRVPQDAYIALKRYHRKRKEHFFTITLDGSHSIISIRIVSIGLVNRALVHPREIFYEAIRDNSTSVIIAHNHPSGHTDPSREDREVTRRLSEAGDILGIRILDHVIFSPTGYYSFLEHGEL